LIEQSASPATKYRFSHVGHLWEPTRDFAGKIGAKLVRRPRFENAGLGLDIELQQS